jgi:hypothetical protein
MGRVFLALLSGAACSSGSAGDLTPLGDAGDGGNDGGDLVCTFSMLPAYPIDFGRVVVGSSETKMLIVTNTSDCPTTLSPLVPQGVSASFFSVARASADFTDDYQYTMPIPPNGKVTFAVTFRPPPSSSYADVEAYLTLNFTPGGYINVGLKG